MIAVLRALLRSLVLRHAFCSMGEHKRETIAYEIGHLVFRCLDCGRRRELGAVFVHVSNRNLRRKA